MPSLGLLIAVPDGARAGNSDWMSGNPRWTPQPEMEETVVIDGRTWWMCPIRGAGCFRVSDRIGDDWARDALDVHVRLHHRRWR
jgi:hypothetical protein